MVTKVRTVAFQGIDAVLVDVQVQVAAGLPAFLIVGMPDKAVKEAGERVRAALHASGLSLPPKRITINLAPADLPKEGSHYDLPIALGLMGAIGAVPADAFEGQLALGELGLDGRLAPSQAPCRRPLPPSNMGWASSARRRPDPRRRGPARISPSPPSRACWRWSTISPAIR